MEPQQRPCLGLSAREALDPEVEYLSDEIPLVSGPHLLARLEL